MRGVEVGQVNADLVAFVGVLTKRLWANMESLLHVRYVGGHPTVFGVPEA